MSDNLPTPHIELFAAADGYRLGVRVWPTNEPRVRAVFVHGIISHGGWYAGSCAALARAGVEVHFLDRRGSGLNLAAPGDVDHWHSWLSDVEQYLRHLAPPRPTVLLGISWGGKLAAAFARYRPELLAGFAMICPGLFAYQQPGLFQRLLVRCAAATPLASARVTIPLQDPALFTQSPAWRRFLRDDPLILRKITLRFAAEDLKLTRYATQAPEAIRVPALLVLAGRERIVDNQRTRRYFERLASRDKRLIEYPEAAHTLEFEPDPTRYFTDLAEWVLQHAG